MNQLTKKAAWIFLLSVFTSGVAAYAATYNFYFNNTEQGDNGTATPNVVVNDGKRDGGKTLDPKAPGDEKSPAPVAAANSPDASTTVNSAGADASDSQSVAAAPRDVQTEPPFRHVRITAGVADLMSANAASIGLGVFFNRVFGLNLYGLVFNSPTPGSNANWLASSTGNTVALGLEFELTPIRIAIGRLDDVIDLAALIGMSTVSPDGDNWVSPHVGARLSVNLGSRWGLTATGRFNAGYAMVDGGLAFRF